MGPVITFRSYFWARVSELQKTKNKIIQAKITGTLFMAPSSKIGLSNPKLNHRPQRFHLFSRRGKWVFPSVPSK
jgi:hypothetical protein